MAYNAPPWTRFWAKVDKNGPLILDTRCWVWTGSLNERGYGRFLALNDERVYAHRFSYELANGEIPDGLRVCHRCDLPACVNPAHFFLGTDKENLEDCKRKGRIARGTQRISTDVRVQLRTLYAQGIGTQELARRFRISTKTARTWALRESPRDAERRPVQAQQAGDL